MDKDLIKLHRKYRKEERKTNAVYTQKILDDQNTGVNEFLEEIVQKYKLSKRPNVYMRYLDLHRTNDKNPTDDKIVEIVLDNRLLAIVYLRRTEFNYIEGTFIDLNKS